MKDGFGDMKEECGGGGGGSGDDIYAPLLFPEKPGNGGQVS